VFRPWATFLKAAEAAHVQTGQPGIAVKVVKLALFGVGQNLISFGNPLELFFRHLVPGVLVRMIPEGQPPVGGPDFLQGGVAHDLQDLIIVRHSETTSSPWELRMAAPFFL
jgi:hypothetical protein